MLRQYIINIIYTLVGAPFKVWVDGVLAARNEKLTKERNLGIILDPEIMRAFRASKNVSSKKIFILFTIFCTSRQRKSHPFDEAYSEEKKI